MMAEKAAEENMKITDLYDIGLQMMVAISTWQLVLSYKKYSLDNS